MLCSKGAAISMSTYATRNVNSDIDMFTTDTGAHVVCAQCMLDAARGFIVFPMRYTAYKHLLDHRAADHKVPQASIDALSRECFPGAEHARFKTLRPGVIVVKRSRKTFSSHSKYARITGLTTVTIPNAKQVGGERTVPAALLAGIATPMPLLSIEPAPVLRYRVTGIADDNDEYIAYDNWPCTLVRWIVDPEEDYDAEVLPMAEIIFADGKQVSVFPEELFSPDGEII
jgi:hypothetical protein